LLKSKLQQHVDPNILKAKRNVELAIGQIERGFRAAPSLLAQSVGTKVGEPKPSVPNFKGMAKGEGTQPGKAPAWFAE
jgi:hypothetical protein